jgi:hypothetical protein
VLYVTTARAISIVFTFRGESNDDAGIYEVTLDGGACDSVVYFGIEMVEDLHVDWVVPQYLLR